MLAHQIDLNRGYVHNSGKSGHIRQLLHGRNEAARFVDSVCVLMKFVEKKRFQVIIHIDVSGNLT